jgi:two-component system, chemotaxis family, chemotaxis protein CheY
MANPLKILIVEDTLDTRELLHYYFTNAGYSVSTAVDGQEGLYMVKTEKPDLIITDVSMPNMNGTEMIRHIRSDGEIAHIPILVFTAVSSSTEEELSRAGANRVFHKPFDFNELQKIVRGLPRQSDNQS